MDGGSWWLTGVEGLDFLGESCGENDRGVDALVEVGGLSFFRGEENWDSSSVCVASGLCEGEDESGGECGSLSRLWVGVEDSTSGEDISHLWELLF